MATDSLTIKSYPDLSLAVMRRRLDSQYRVWLLARHLDSFGRGRVLLKELRRFAVATGLFNRQSFYRFATARCLFWHRYHQWMYITGVKKLALALDVEFQSPPVLLPLACFSSMHDFRAVLVASYFADKPRTIAIDTLAALTGRTRRVVSRYLDSSHVRKTPNAMLSERRPSQPLVPELRDQGYFHTMVGGRHRVAKRMPNTYESDLETAPRGMTREKRGRPSSVTGRHPPGGEGPLPSSPEKDLSDPGGAPCRRYFCQPKGVNRALQSLSPHETIYTLCPGQTDGLGFQLWQGWTAVEAGDPRLL